MYTLKYSNFFPVLQFDRLIYRITLVFCFSLCLAGGADAESTSYNRALEAYNNQDYETALPIWRELAQGGNADAEYALGVTYFKGEGVPRDLSESMKWFERAAKSGNVNAMFNLGAAYWEGNGTRQSYAEAVEWWEKSAADGQPASQYNLGLAYYLGKGAEQDLDKSIKWIRQAAENDHAGAKHILPVIENELPQSALPEISTTDREAPTKTAPSSTTGKTNVIAADYRAAVVVGHGGQAYAKQDSDATVLADLTAGTPVKLLSSREGWARINVPAVASVRVYGKYVVNRNGGNYILGTRVRARSLPSTGKNSITVGIFDDNERVQVLTERDDWKQVSAPPRLALWILIEQLEVYPEVTSDWLGQWNQATSGPSAIAITTRTEVATTDLEDTDKLSAALDNNEVGSDKSAPEPFRPSVVVTTNAEVLGANRDNASVLKLLSQNTPVKVITQKGKWVQVRLPTPINIWIYGRYVAQQGDTASITGNQIRARSLPTTTSQSSVLGLLEDGAPVTVISKEGDWIRVSVLDLVAAWMRIDQLRIFEQETDDWRALWNTAQNNR